MSPLRSLSLVVIALGLAACGSDGESDAAPAADEGGSTVAEAAPPTSADPSQAVGPGSGTLTMADGTVYVLEMSTCDTSENGAEGFVIPESYDLLGRTADGAFVVQVIRAGLDEDFVSEIATLEGAFDADGQNAELIYRHVTDTLALTVDGGNVSGTVTLKPIGPNRPHGDEMAATVEVRC